MTTGYTFAECEGSAMPYPYSGPPTEYPDSLEPVFINHVGRHGARFPASSANCLKLKRALEHADSIGTITPLGRRLRSVNDRIIALSNNRVGFARFSRYGGAGGDSGENVLRIYRSVQFRRHNPGYVVLFSQGDDEYVLLCAPA